MSVTYLGSRQQEHWQKRFDAWFPDGAIASWQEEPGPGHPIIYAVPWVEVVAADGTDPVLLLRPYGTYRVVGPYKMTDYDVLRTKPHVLVLATVTGAPRPLLLAAGMDDRRKRQMAPERARQQAEPYPSYIYGGGGEEGGSGTRLV